MTLLLLGVAALVIFGGLAALMVIRARQTGDEIEDVGERWQKRSRDFLAVVFGVLGALMFALFGIAQQTGESTMTTLMLLLDVVGANPEVSMGVIVAGLGSLSISGAISIGPWRYFGISMMLIGFGFMLAARRRLDNKMGAAAS